MPEPDAASTPQVKSTADTAVPPGALLDLVARFERNREAYKSPAYNETQVRREFIDPLFKALGWDIDNELGYAEAYKDVIHEDAIKVGGATKAPDYCFRIGGTRKFFLEAKKPAVGIRDDREPAYQLRRYAWSARLPLSVLTDFEELAVYDCRIRPNQNDPASRARTLYFTYSEYAARWEELSGLLGKQAVLRGSFDKYVESAKKKRGTAEVDAEILKEIEGWRHILARNFALRNDNLGVRDINFAVTRTIDRILFLRMCEDRGIEPYGRLRQLLNGDAVYERLGALFREADDRYNSSLFYFRQEKGREPPDELTLSLKLDDAVLKAILKKLYYPESPYEFSVLPTEILGQVYEQFLGKVIRLTGESKASGARTSGATSGAGVPARRLAKVEEKPEVRKAGGVYYTPTYIVDYIVKHTVGELLKDKTPADIAPPPEGPRKRRRKRGSIGVPPVSVDSASPASHSRSVAPPLRGGGLTRTATLRILDPACGSGSFLLGAYQFLLDWHRDWYAARIEGDKVSGAGLRARESAPSDPSLIDQSRAPTDQSRAPTDPSRARKEAGLAAGNAADDSGAGLRARESDQSRARKEAVAPTGLHSRTTPPPSPALQPAPPPSPALQPAPPPSPALQPGPWSNRIYRGAGGQWRLTIQEKKRILLNHIYGVDIDPQAVEVTKLSLLLKVLENETAETIGSNLRLFHERALPDLDRNIKCGNSLIGPDFYEGKQFDMFDEEQRYRINAFDWPAEFPDAFAADNPGFDAVIGNPPYVRQESLKQFKGYLSARYAAFDSTADLYVCFIERAVRLLRVGGLHSYIVSSGFLRTNFGAGLRRFLRQSAAILELVDFGGLAVFEDAKDTYVCIPLIGRASQPAHVAIAKVAGADQTGLTEAASYAVPLARFTDAGWSTEREEVLCVFDKVRSRAVPLGELVKRRIYLGVKTGLNKAFEVGPELRQHIISEQPIAATLIRRFLGGQDIRRYHVRDSERYLIAMPSGWTRACMAKAVPGSVPRSEREAWQWLKDTYPAIAAHLKPFSELAQKRQDRGEYWWELRACDYYDVLDGPKIIYPDIAKNPRFHFDDGTTWIRNTAYCLATDDRYLLGLLNSRLLWFAVARISIPFGTRAGEYRYRMFTQYIEQLPIHRIDFNHPRDAARHDQVVTLVQRMLDLHRELAAARTTHDKTALQRQIDATDRQIDRLVYDLYGLTDDEVAIVEGSAV